MPFTAPQISNGTKHIPAWKKLGLKLKSPYPDLSHASQDSTGTSPVKPEVKGTKRKVSGSDTENSHSLQQYKKWKPPASPSSLSVLPPNGTQNAQSAPKLKKQKSVTFTPETKVEDGDSIKQLFKAWVAEQKAEDPSFEPEKLGDAFKSSKSKFGAATVSKPGVKGDNKPKKKKGDSKNGKHIQPSAKLNSGHLHSAIVYLLGHHRARENWKFNKAKQSYLIKHLFDFEKVPADYDEPLRDYIAGLQGEAVRVRVHEAAQSAKDEEAAQNDSEGAIGDRTRKSIRADLLMSALGVVNRTNIPETHSQNGTNRMDKSTKALGRMRKRRTLIDEDDDSTSSSSSESRSSGSSDSESFDSADDPDPSSRTSGSSSSDSSEDSTSDSSNGSRGDTGPDGDRSRPSDDSDQ